MNNSGYNAYRHSAGNAVLSKDQILIRLYKGMIKFVSLAKRGIEMKRNTFLLRALIMVLIVIATAFPVAGRLAVVADGNSPDNNG